MKLSTFGSQLLNFCPATVKSGEQRSDVYGEITCSCIAASAVTGFHVEPGG
jgi:hypothetical protein